MMKCRKELDEARRENVDGSWYVPRLAIERVINSDTISQLSPDISISGEVEDPILASVLRQGKEQIIREQAKVTFAIACFANPSCIHYVADLIRYAIKRGWRVDNRLPFSEIELQDCGLDEANAKAFYSTQWHFIVPKIQLGAVVPDEFRPELILPLRQLRLPPDTGAFGTVIEVCVEEGHQVEPIYSGRVNFTLVFAV